MHIEICCEYSLANHYIGDFLAQLYAFHVYISSWPRILVEATQLSHHPGLIEYASVYIICNKQECKHEYEEECATVYEDKCDTVYEEKCKTEYAHECTNVPSKVS